MHETLLVSLYFSTNEQFTHPPWFNDEHFLCTLGRAPVLTRSEFCTPFLPPVKGSGSPAPLVVARLSNRVPFKVR